MPRTWVQSACLAVIVLTLVRGDPATAAGAVLEDCRIRIRVDMPGELPGWRELARRCAEEFVRLAPAARHPVDWVRLRVSDSPLPRGEPLTVELAADVDSVHAVRAILKALLNRHLRTTWQLPAPPDDRVEWFLAAGINRVVLSHRRGGWFPEPDFRPVAQLLADGGRLNPGQLMDAPPAPGSYLAYSLYSVHCRLLTTVLRDRDPAGRRINEILQLAGRGRRGSEALSLALRAEEGVDVDVLAWYGERAAGCLSRFTTRLDADQVEARVQDLEQVRVALPGRVSGRAATAAIEDAVVELHAMRADTDELARIKSGFLSLSQEAPVLLQPALAHYIQAFVELDTGSRRRFRNRIRQARRDLGDALLRQRQMEAYLVEWEAAHLPIDLQFGLYFEAVRRHRQRVTTLHPECSALLDAWERR